MKLICEACTEDFEAPTGDNGSICQCGITYYTLNESSKDFFGVRDDDDTYIVFIHLETEN